MEEDTETLFEIMLAADRFCGEIEAAASRIGPITARTELRLKIAQCRTMIRQARERYDNNELTIETRAVRAIFRNLILASLWVAFYARAIITRKMFRKLVVIESGFTYLLASRE